MQWTVSPGSRSRLPGELGTILGFMSCKRSWPSCCLRKRWRLAALLLSLVAPVPGLASGPALEPGPGILLVAGRDLVDPTFARTVVLLVQHTANGTLGLVLNRPVPHTLDEALPELEITGPDPPFLFFGGPVGMDGLMFLFRGEPKSEDALHVIDDTHLGADRELLEKRLGTASGYSRLRVFIGHAGWAPGQLDREIARGDWHLRHATEDTVWTPTAGDLWYQLIDSEHPEGQIVQLSL